MLQFHEILLRKKIREIKTSIHIFAAQASSGTIDIVVKPRDSNDVWGPDNDLSKSSWDYEKKFTDDKDVYGVVKHVPEDYFFATTPRYYCNEIVEFPRVHD